MKMVFPAACTLLLVLVVAIFSSPFAARSEAAPFVVNSLSDTDDGSCSALHCSLREAINAANTNPGADTISFDVTGTITLGSTLPQITDPAGLAITAQPRQVTISGNHAVRILSVASGAPLTLEGLSLVDGYTTNGGGAIDNEGPLTVTQCTFSYNHAGWGGAINNSIFDGQLSVIRCTFYGNSAAGNGGAILHGSGIATILNSTFTGNTAANGAALLNGTGWGINVYYSTIAGNSASAGACVFNASGSISLYGAIVANTTAAANCGGPIQNIGHNLDSAASCGWGTALDSRSNTDPLLRPLANNGGGTDTMALQAASPAIDTGGATGLPAFYAGGQTGIPSTDQRGIPRPFGQAYDIGAFEHAPSGVPVIHLLLDE
ncbi:MAG: choice-of-anchor Q domain-containing protein [Syntrophobacteraceae bacterium]